MNNLPDIAGASTTVHITTPNITARWVILLVSGTGTVRFGGPSVTSSLGLPIASGSSLALPILTADGLSTSPYSLAGMYAYIPTGATLSVAYEPFN